MAGSVVGRSGLTFANAGSETPVTAKAWRTPSRVTINVSAPAMRLFPSMNRRPCIWSWPEPRGQSGVAAELAAASDELVVDADRVVRAGSPAVEAVEGELVLEGSRGDQRVVHRAPGDPETREVG